MSFFASVAIVFLLLALLICLLLLKRERQGRQADGARWESRRLRLEQELSIPQRQLERLMALVKDLYAHTVSDGGRVPRRELADALVDAARILLQADSVILLQMDLTLELTATAGCGISAENLSRLRIRPGQGPLGRAIQDRAPVLEQDPHADLIEEMINAPYLIIPLRVQSRSAGLLLLSRPREGRFGADALDLAAVLAGQAGLCLENLELTDKLERYYDDMVHSLARAIDVKDAYTHDHSDRSYRLARELAEEIRLPEAFVRIIGQGAYLHDLGKIGIEDAVLQKPGKLTPEEYAVIKRHPEMGYRILQPVRFLRPVSTIVLYHHEWVNGEGYPEGLAGEEIPLGSRVVSVVDAWDAMTSNRPYRQAMSKTAAIAELRRQAGTQFDSKLVEAFLRVLDRLDRAGVPTTELHPEATQVPSSLAGEA